MRRWTRCWPGNACANGALTEFERDLIGERTHAELAAAVQEATGETVTLADVDQGYTGETPKADAAAHGIVLEVVKLPDVKRGFVLLPRRWVVERDFGWMSRFRRLARDQERLADVLKGFHLIAFTMLMWKQVLPVLSVL